VDVKTGPNTEVEICARNPHVKCLCSRFTFVLKGGKYASKTKASVVQSRTRRMVGCEKEERHKYNSFPTDESYM
jgi:hypothetical protein